MNLEVSSQTLPTHKDSVKISRQDAYIIKKSLRLGVQCDSIMKHQDFKIEDLELKISGFKRETIILIDKNTETEKSLIWANRKVKILGFTVKFGIPIGIVGGFLLSNSLK